MSSICDSIIECPGYHDEVFCDLPPCPEGCECLAYMIHCDNVTKLSLFYSRQPIHHFVISIINCHMDINLLQFKYMNYIKFLDLSGNNFMWVCTNIDHIKTELHLLNLAFNLVSLIRTNCFGKLKVVHISFQMNKIRHLGKLAFHHQKDTQSINLDRNKLEYLSLAAFSGMESLKNISAMQNSLRKIDGDIFLTRPWISLSIDSILLCCIYKDQNPWCSTVETTSISCPHIHYSGFYPLGLVIGSIEFVFSIMICFIYLAGYLSRLIEASSYRTSLVFMHIDQALYGLSIVLTDVHVRPNKFGSYIMLEGSLNPTVECIVASICSYVAIIYATLVQVIISFIRYEAIKYPFFTEIKRPIIIRNIMTFILIACLLVTIALLIVFYKFAKEKSFYTTPCSLLQHDAQDPGGGTPIEKVCGYALPDRPPFLKPKDIG